MTDPEKVEGVEGRIRRTTPLGRVLCFLRWRRRGYGVRESWRARGGVLVKDCTFEENKGDGFKVGPWPDHYSGEGTDG